MTFLRHSSRHVHHSVAAHIESGLATLGWTDATAANRPFGSPQLRFQRTPATITGRNKDISVGLVSITLGDEAPPDELEMGGPLSSTELPIFVDIFMGTDAEATAVALDVRDILMGRFDFALVRSIDVTDQALLTPVDGWRIDFEDVERVRPDHTLSLHWQVVKVTAAVTFSEVTY